MAGVGTGTVARYNRVMNSDDEELKKKVLANEVSINAGYKDLIESNLRQRVLGNTNPVKLGRCFIFLNKYYGFERGGNGSNQYEQKAKLFTIANPNIPSNQIELADSYNITRQTMNNYMRMASMIPELEDLQDEKSKLCALISNNFGRRKNDPAKDQKALETYVELRGYKQHDNQWTCQNGATTKSTLDEIAKELNMSTTNLKRALRIERNLTDSMKELAVYYVLIISCIKDFWGNLGC